MKEASKKILVIGQIVSTNLYGLGRGVIYGIEGDQSPGTVNNSFGGVICSGGNATFDIAFESGSLSKKLPECILRGIQWTIFNEVMNAADVVKVYRSALAAELKKLDDEAAQALAFSLAVENIKTAPEYVKLTQGNSDITLATSNIRKELKAAFPKAKFSVRKSNYDCVNINWTDGPTEDEVKAIISKYKGGRFNGMEDIYESISTPFNEVYGSVSYLFTNREYSDNLTEKAIELFKEKNNDRFDTEISLEKYNAGDLWRIGSGEFWHGHGVGGEINNIRAKLS
ncbi:LPD29 domain-containing protein [Yersinia sp. LJYL362]|uniref:LPD29 domain-containing protein n=1 Tax=Yersinia sp. LJYL362 TaxID=3402108 RepID=UPI003AB19579